MHNSRNQLLTKAKIAMNAIKEFTEECGFDLAQIVDIDNRLYSKRKALADLNEKSAKVEKDVQTRMAETENELQRMKAVLMDKLSKAEKDRISASKELASAKKEREKAQMILSEAEGIRRQADAVVGAKQRQKPKEN